MEKMKQISVKIDPMVLKLIDDYVRNTKYANRNAVINSVLGAVFCRKDWFVIDRMRMFTPLFYEVSRLEFESKQI